MRRLLRWLGIGLGAFAFSFALLALAIALAPYPAVEARPGPAIPGVFHVHADGSHDGFGTLDEATRAAAATGARFLVLTEHNVLRPDRPIVQNGVVVVPGVEISAQPGHVVALALAEVPPPEERGPDVLQAIAAREGVAVLAHPVNLRRPWTDPGVDHFAGFEALSLDSSFRLALARAPWRLGLAAAALAGDRRKVGALLVDRPDDGLARYDQVVAESPVALLCGVDAHGLPPYASSFGAMNLYVPGPLSGDAARDAEAVITAIRAHLTFCGVPALGDASSFSFSAGPEEVAARVQAPGVTLALYRDGVRVAQGPGPELRVAGGAGRWRAEVTVDRPGFPFRDGALWIASSAQRVHER